MRALACGLLFVTTSLGTAQTSRPNVSERAVVAAAARYVAAYEKQFAFLIADERYRQQQLGADGQTVQTRRLRSELFLTYLPADNEWIAVRDVLEVDGMPVTDRQDLRALLSRSDQLRGLTGKIVAINARYNIGRVERNFNEPTLPLLLLGDRRVSRVSFDRKSVTEENGTTLVTLAFEEKDGPTLVSFRNEGPARSRGEFVVDAASGTVRRTVFRLARPGIDVRLETTYTKDARLDLWLPSTFVERYESGGRVNARRGTSDLEPHEVIECEAAYTNYRRFDVTWRIKPPY